ncbi:MAG TPA: DNA-binding protein [Desulfosporosinus sp.]|nr:DNA-binding protein [Desulfosporosinus sp.]
MPRMRTIKQAIQSIKEQDPGTCFSEWWLRRLVKSGELKCHKAGNRYLIDLDLLDRFLKTPPITEEVKQPYGIVRKINT